ncbi:LysM peptidoglycan-binding domain-containing protein [Enterococcus durans]|uniref:LysM peptidoglycan-binding domain-containing protein n=1 Tax=Enterococcus durans TaxID=53345 RepID=UPI00071BC762|nr:LysM peptidoglycan-binding domain-containing protein [Enterococcus durans]KST49651.1 peptidoglycan-binding protein LysM [Enterococcus durans]
MKKMIGSLLVLASLLLFTACGKKVTTDDLKANDWLIEATKDDEPNMIASFSDHIVSLSVDTSKMKSTASDEWEAMGEEFAKSLVDQMNYKFEYTLEGNVMTWKDDKDKDNDAKYTVSKEDKNIILTPEKSNKSDDKEKLVLKPYKKEKTKDSRTTTSSTSSNEQSSSTTTESTITSSSTVEQAAIAQNTPPETSSTYSAESVENYVEATPSSNMEQVVTPPSTTEQSVPQDYVPAGQPPQPAPPASSSTETSAGSTTTVQSGESPKQVAERVGITVDQLFALNGIDPNNYFLYPGQELIIK